MVPPIVIAAHPKRHEPEPIELGLMLSRLTRAPIDVVGTFWFDGTPQRTASDDYSRILRDEVREALERSVGDPDRAPGEVRIHVGFAPAKYALHETASRVGAGLIVVASTHRGAVGRIALGSTPDRVLAGAPCPVAVSPRGFRDELLMPERVGVAFEDTPGGWAALRAGAAIARHTGAGLIAYTVIESHTHDKARDRAEVAVERAIAKHGFDIRSEARVLTDGGVDALVGESHGLDFLVRGSRSHGPVRRPLAIGRPGKLARKVACPLVVVPPGVDQPLVSLFGAHVGVDSDTALPTPCSSSARLSGSAAGSAAL
jgi:nucleotide-binding universal stress UspA family protein